MRDPTRPCLFCGRPYPRKAKPVWVFWPDGRCAGTAHTGCARKPAAQRAYLAGGRTSRPLAVARADRWLTRLHAPAPTQSAGWYAGMLFANGHAAVLNEEQWQLLPSWEQGPLRLSPARCAAILAVYRALVAAYTAWRATVPAEAG